eukprot:3934604-Rhodomonas_salina.2
MNSFDSVSNAEMKLACFDDMFRLGIDFADRCRDALIVTKHDVNRPEREIASAQYACCRIPDNLDFDEDCANVCASGSNDFDKERADPNGSTRRPGC